MKKIIFAISLLIILLLIILSIYLKNDKIEIAKPNPYIITKDSSSTILVYNNCFTKIQLDVYKEGALDDIAILNPSDSIYINVLVSYKYTILTFFLMKKNF